MINKLIILLFATFLMADDNNITINNNIDVDKNITATQKVMNLNPKVYAALGDIVYNNVAKIEKLQEIPRYSKNIDKIQLYVDNVSETKDIGYSIENGTSSVSKGEYLKFIRALSKRNDEFMREVVTFYKSSITSKDNEFFSQMINSGLLDTQKYKNEIMDYYLEHANQIDTTGVIQAFLDEDELLKKQAAASKKLLITKQQIQDAKIRRLRQNDKNKEAKIQQELDAELNQKKDKILQEQLENLSK